MKRYIPDNRLINRLLIKLDPMFFSYSETEQATRRQHFMFDQSDQIDSFLYRELFGLQYHPVIATQ